MVCDIVTAGKAPMGKLHLVDTPFSTVCIDITGPFSPLSDGYRYILTLIYMYVHTLP